MHSTKHTYVPFDRIEVGALGNCRTTLTKIDELAADILERGLLQPLVVWHKHLKTEAFELPDGRKVWDRYILVAGNRRHAALALIRKDDPGAFEKVPVSTFVGNEDDALFAQLAENLQREDMSPTDTADAILRMKTKGYTLRDIAKKLSKSVTWVSQLAALREHSIVAVLRAAEQSKIPLTVAVALSRLDESAQARELERYTTTLARGQGKEATPTAEAKAEARAALDAATGRVRRPSVTEIRTRMITLRESDATLAAVLMWVLGEGEWPSV